MTDTFKKLVESINPTAGSGTTEWLVVPTGHQYQAYVRPVFNASAGSAPTEYTIYGLSSSGVAPTSANIEKRNTIEYGDEPFYHFDMGPGEVLAVGSDSDRVTFTARGLDIDG